MAEKRKRKWGDRRDGHRVYDTTGLNVIMAHIMPNRADAEVWFYDEFDITEVLQFIAKKNAEHPNYKTTIFHCIVLPLPR